MRFVNLFSGSSGNCSFLEHNGARLLIDCGVSARRAEKALAEIGIDPKTLLAILITHEHSDHIVGVNQFARKNGCKLYASPGTWQRLDGLTLDIADEKKAVIDACGVLNFGEMEVCAFDTNHDVLEPLGFLFTDGKHTVGYATDTGYIDADMEKHLMHASFLFLEANHDVAMLQQGPYPPFLKQRILGKKGHLSNDDCASFVCRLVRHGTLQHVRLAHLSSHNNTPQTAYHTVGAALKSIGCDSMKDVLIDVARKGQTGTPVIL